jgi:hypothetical protein
MQATLTFQTLDQIDIFHEGQPAESTDSFENVAADEQRLIAVRQVKARDSEPDAKFEETRSPVAAVQRESERAADDAGCVSRFGHDVQPIRRQPGISVKEQQPFAASDGRTGIHLRTASTRRSYPARPFESMFEIPVAQRFFTRQGQR